MSFSEHATAPHPKRVPAPWESTGEAYIIPISSPSVREGLPKGAYPPLKADSLYAFEESSGKYRGGLNGVGMVYIVRYKESPAGMYL